MTFTLAFTGGSVRPQFTGGVTTNGTTRSSSGTFTEVITAGAANTTFGFEATGAGVSNVYTIDNVSVRPQ